MRYRAECTDRLGFEHEVDFEAPSDKEALERALAGPVRLERLLRPSANVNYLIWERSPMLHCKWVCDGARDIDQVIGRLEGFLDEVKEMKAEGMTLAQPVDGGYILLTRPEDQA